MTTTTIRVGNVWVELLDDDDAIVRMAKNGKPWELETRSVWRSLIRAGEGMIDVGAYTGIYAIASAMLGAKVVAIEPHPTNYARLRRNAAINSVKIQMIEAAASNRKCIRDLYTKRPVQRISDTGSLDDTAACAIRVGAIRIDDLKLPRPVCLIKIDTERHEADVIRGAMKVICEDRPLVLAEILTPEDQVRVSSLLAMLGYRQTHILDGRNRLYGMA